MSDLFHKKVQFEFIDKIMDIIEATILTKRTQRMYQYFTSHPIPRNVWLGVTVDISNSKDRIDYLRELEAPIKSLSPVNLF